MKRQFWVPVVALLALAIAGCGSSGTNATSQDTGADPSASVGSTAVDSPDVTRSDTASGPPPAARSDSATAGHVSFRPVLAVGAAGVRDPGLR
jgi:hypothetical protein